MDLNYHKKRTSYILKNLEPIIKKANIEKLQKVEPYRNNVNKAIKVIEDFIYEKGRIIYGGLALNEFIKLQNKNDAIYEEDSLQIPDYDIYTPEPINDLIYICNKLFNLGFTDVYGRSAVHNDTYTINLDSINSSIIDLHYVWKQQYNLIPKKKIGKFFYTDPEFMYIDIYKIYTDPLLSWDFRLEKSFKRGSLLEYHYPITKPQTKFNPDSYTIKDSIRIDIIKYLIKSYLINNQNIIMINEFVYNYFMKKCNSNYKINISHIEILTSNIQTTYDNILELLYLKYKKDLITKKYYHQFFELFDNSVEIYYDSKLIIKIYKNLNRCVPYITVNIDTNPKDNINLISFHGLLLHYYSYLFYYKCHNNYDEYIFTKHLIYNLISEREKYLKKNNLTGIEKSIFKELIIDCKYKTVDARILNNIAIQQRLKDKKPPIFQYKPRQRILNKAPDFKFSNSSGNEINIKKNEN